LDDADLANFQRPRYFAQKPPAVTGQAGLPLCRGKEPISENLLNHILFHIRQKNKSGKSFGWKSGKLWRAEWQGSSRKNGLKMSLEFITLLAMTFILIQMRSFVKDFLK
jgi:hypothetical protein